VDSDDTFYLERSYLIMVDFVSSLCLFVCYSKVILETVDVAFLATVAKNEYIWTQSIELVTEMIENDETVTQNSDLSECRTLEKILKGDYHWEWVLC